MSSTITQARPTTPFAILPDVVAVSLFSMLGLTLSVVVLSYVSSEVIRMMFCSIG